MAYWRRKPESRVLLHSDQGSHYTSRACQKLLVNLNIELSISRKGNCWDNAVAESFFGSFKQERVQCSHYQTRYEAQQDILDYISMFYNSHQLHPTLGYMSPNEYENQLMVKLKNVV
jgi:putative transposase